MRGLLVVGGDAVINGGRVTDLTVALTGGQLREDPATAETVLLAREQKRADSRDWPGIERIGC